MRERLLVVDDDPDLVPADPELIEVFQRPLCVPQGREVEAEDQQDDVGLL